MSLDCVVFRLFFWNKINVGKYTIMLKYVALKFDYIDINVSN